MEEQTAEAVEENPIRHLALVDLNKVSAGIADLRARYAGVVFDVSTSKGMDEAKKARMAVREPRYAVEKIRKEQASRIRAAQVELNSVAERITNALREIEDPIDAQIKAEEERKERERQEAILREQKRVEGIRGCIDWMKGLQSLLLSQRKNSYEIEAAANELAEKDIHEVEFQEFTAEAVHVRQQVVDELMALVKSVREQEREVAAAKERARLLDEKEREIAELKARLAAAEAAVAKAAEPPPAPEPEPTSEPMPETQAYEPNYEGVVLTTYKGEVVYDANAEVKVEVGPIVEPEPAMDLATVSENRLFEDEYPGTDRIIFAVESHFGVSTDVAKSYITKAGDDIAFQG